MYFIRIGPTLQYLKNSNVFFFLLFRFGQRRQKGNQSYRRFRFTRESFYADEIKAQREFFSIPSSSMFSVSIKSLDTSKSRT